MSCLTIRTRTVATPDHPLTHTHIPSRTHSTSPLYTPYGFSQYASPGFVFFHIAHIMSNSSLVRCQVVLCRSESQKLKIYKEPHRFASAGFQNRKDMYLNFIAKYHPTCRLPYAQGSLLSGDAVPPMQLTSPTVMLRVICGRHYVTGAKFNMIVPRQGGLSQQYTNFAIRRPYTFCKNLNE